MNVRITTTHGDITLELNPEKAPITVENFISYAKSGHYDGTIFHRVIEDFMIQGGGLDKEMKDKATNASIQNEADNGLGNLDLTVAMARTADPHSASAQFFINTKDNSSLNFKNKRSGWGYCVFGKVIKGIEVVDAIEATPTTRKSGRSDVPVSEILIKSIKRNE